MIKAFLPLVILGTIGFVACKSATIPAPAASVSFAFAPRACSSVVPVHFAIDGIEVGVDTFNVAVGGGNHLMSRAYSTSPGQHSLSAHTDRYIWSATTVGLGPGQTFTDSLPFYCS
jgi:hypothetical protein